MKINFDLDTKKLEELPREIDASMSKSIRQEALRLSKMLKEGLASQSPGGVRFQPLSPRTIARKGSSKALIDTGSMLRSISASKFKGGWKIGIRRSAVAKDRNGNVINLSDLALFHEGIGRVPNKVPARPFIIPVYKVWVEDFVKRVTKSAKKDIGL